MDGQHTSTLALLGYGATTAPNPTYRQSVQLGIFLVCRIFAGVIDGVNPCATERLRRGQRMNRRTIKEPDGVFDKLGKSVVFVYVFTSVEHF